MNNVNITPFVKWAGGKRQLLDQIISRMPKQYINYYEPFVGGGAVLFKLLPASAVINDINKSLINAYRYIKDEPEELIKKIIRLDQLIPIDGKEYYYENRKIYNSKLIKGEFDIDLAAIFIFINKHCFNGLYRVNGKGLFNVPYNQSRNVSCDADNIRAISKYIKTITILDGDFGDSCRNADKGDFIFFDSPYAPLNPASFESYSKEGFDIESHKRLAKLFNELTDRGCYCMLTNHNTEFINNLYKEYKMDVVSARRSINSKGNARTGEEIIVTNY